MDGRGLARSVKAATQVGAAQGLRAVRASWRHRRADSVGLPRRGPERARVPGSVVAVDPEPGGGRVHFARSRLRIMVTVNGAVFWGWDGADPEPSYALSGVSPEPDARVTLEPDKDGGWRVVSERATVTVSRHGAIEVCTPGGVMLRRDLPPRWWESEGGAEPHWVQRSELAADARFFGLGGRSSGLRLRDGTYRLWNNGPGGSFAPGEDPLALTMPVQMVVADAGTHLVFHDTTWGGTVDLREGCEGNGSGHDRAGGSELRMEGGPLRCWTVVGSPARVLHTWAQLTGGASVPPSWALGHHHGRQGFASEAEVRRVVAGHKEHMLPLEAVHVDIGPDEAQGFAADRDGSAWLPRLAEELRADGVRLVSVVAPAVKPVRGNAVYDGGRAIDAFVRDSAGRAVRGVVRDGESVYPDFTAERVRKWWGGLYEERLGQGFSGFSHDMDEPVSLAAFGDPTFPLAARHDLDGRGGDHREAHNIYGLCMARAGYEGLRELQPQERPFVFSRSGWAGTARYGGTWSGDVATGWHGLRSSLSLVLGLGLCGVPCSGPDVDSGGELSPELFLRRFQLGAYMPLFRTRSASHADSLGPWAFGDEVLGHARVALDERRRLLPYFVTLAHLARRTGAPYVRPLWWGSPEDRALRDCEDAFLLGDSLLVAPVCEAGVTSRDVLLPQGRWYDTVTGEAFEGPARVTVHAPLSRIPVLARAGAVVPVRADHGGIALDVWAPAPGCSGGGHVVRDAGDGWEEPEVERYRVHRNSGRVVVETDGEGGGEEPPHPVRVRGL
ncbi:glycosyl hydrolase [Streptomyces sp. SID8379]|uniref:glycoside hydrolase family 31 protein n=1 Tax=unclassified Streptomyces TaxID=2593676 RepID=UPI000476EB9E|nr:MULTISPECIES: glycoside hydrolase family 31 protein [unclassified Streptomyces]MYW64893.1 glycosyl hydrolase [Streptomyces sp. SID8379]